MLTFNTVYGITRHLKKDIAAFQNTKDNTVFTFNIMFMTVTILPCFYNITVYMRNY